ncbi:vWA domain-containing protein [Campylobacter geochelonis]|uniref:VWFA-related Acidobacterial domain n=1 Tax=Campylobacter geochelonis TaxID=1780362 RepID=A0A128EKI4_9BACT|nr:VWA domain-containing protein [Campylobacter geochelonis]QKF70940.1 von Willebrand factor type A (vWA) domain-containing protein (BatA domain), putative oxygen tolerance protein BatA [Campylobacter geochelonis]CZE47001.1 VWFA-related Acidobacterial domain [Campylobacter geochelonis]CZE49107.1 VWFA-related Acidobacterial domain [Campylobacter geochelonis]
MFSFQNLEFLWLLVLLPALLLFAGKKSQFESYFSKDVLKQIYIKNRGFSSKFRANLLILSLAMLIFAIARPVFKGGEIEVKSSFIDVVVGLDISKSMSVDDVFPNRFEFSKNKLFTFLKDASDKRVSIVGFSDRAFLVSPLTKDFESLKFLVKNMNFSYLNLKGTSIISFLKSANSLFDKNEHKVVLIFSDGGDNVDFSKEIAYAKEHNIAVYVYLVATQKGALFKADNGDMAVLKANEAIKNLALQTGGAFLNYSLSNDDIKSISDDMSAKFRDKNEQSTMINEQQELFYYPLVLALVFFFMAIFSLPTRKI